MKKNNRKKIEAVIAIAIAVFFIMPAASVIADEDDWEKLGLSLANVVETPDRLRPTIHASDPFTKPEQKSISFGGDPLVDIWLNYDDGTNENALGLTAGGTMEMAIRLPAGLLSAYAGYELDTVKWYRGYFASAPPAMTGTVYIYSEGTTTTPGPVITSEAWSFPSAPSGQFEELPLSSPVTVTGTEDLWVGVATLHNAGEFPCGMDEDTVHPDGGFLQYDGSGWMTLVSIAFPATWMIYAGLTDAAPPPPVGCDFAVEITWPPELVSSVPQTVKINVSNLGPEPIPEVKKLLDIYKEIPGISSEVLSDDMEGDTSLNWTVVDNGDGDSWTISTDRYNSTNTSFRCTAGVGDDNTYLGHATASPTDDLISNNIDLSGAAAAELSFFHWTQGEYHDYAFLDYGTVGFSSNGGGSWTDVPLADFVAYENAWGEVTIAIEDYISLTSQVQVKFMWESDPHLQYEGWYIDDVSIERTEPPTYELVFQSHIIQSMAGNQPPTEEEFPLNWDPEVDNWYKIVVCGQVYGCVDADPTNNCDEKLIYIGDIHDVGTSFIDGPDRIEKCTFGDFDGLVFNEGTFDEEDVPVEFSVAPIVEDVMFSDNFETGINAWETYSFDGPNLWHGDDWDGTADGKYAACYDPGQFPNYVNGMYINFILTLQNFDLTSASLIDGILEFDAKWSMNNEISLIGGREDRWYFMLYDPASNYVLGTYPYTYFNDNLWSTPDSDPAVCRVDLIEAMDLWHANYPFMFPEYKCGVGFAIWETYPDTDVYEPDNPEIWSGLMIDNVKVFQTFAGTPFYTNTSYVDLDLYAVDIPVAHSWHGDRYCDFAVSFETQLPDDINPDNDIKSTKTRVTTTNFTSTETDNMFHVDLTAGIGSIWHIVSKNETFTEPPTDQYWWCGDDVTGLYLENMDDSLMTPEVNLSAFDLGILEFDTYYDIEDGWDKGMIEVTGDGLRWHTLATWITGFADWHQETYLIPAEQCTENTQVRFRFISDPFVQQKGWYIDDVCIYPVTTDPITIFEDFEGAFPPAGWSINTYSNTGTWEPRMVDGSWRDPYGASGQYAIADSDAHYGVDFDVGLRSPPIDLSMGTMAGLDVGLTFVNLITGADEFAVRVLSTGGTVIEEVLGQWDYDMNQFHFTKSLDLQSYSNLNDIQIEFYYNNAGYWAWFASADDFTLNALLAFPGSPIWCDDIESGEGDWSKETTAAGDWWHMSKLLTISTSPLTGNYSWWCGDDAIGGYPPMLNDVLFTEIDLTPLPPEMEPIYSADVTFDHWRDIGADATGYVEASVTGAVGPYVTLAAYTGVADWEHAFLSLDDFCGEIITLRFRFVSGGGPDPEGWAIDNIEVHYKNVTYKDTIPPITSIIACGEPGAGGYFIGDVTVSLSAVDPAGNYTSGVDKTYYFVDGGAETEYVGPFTVSGDGGHTVTYWSVDNAGNEEAHKTKTFTIDSVAPSAPTITQPEEGGFYILGMKLLSDRPKTTVIGSITIEGTASDATSGIDRVEVYVNDAGIGWSNSGSFSVPWKGMYFGACTLKAIAYDNAGHESAPTTMDVTAYMFGLL